MDIQSAEKFIIQTLEKSLSPTLFYHGIHHTFDVVDASAKIAVAEGITDEESLILLKTAALYHDVGFITTYKGHEEEGCRIAKATLPNWNYSTEQIEQICGMIMATQIPQNPQNLLQQIIADADLDYLGRDDFEPIADSLFRELSARIMVTDIDVWNQIQVKFISAHHYWTASEIALRDNKKRQNLDKVKSLLL
ncbi:MAG: HD domain-containing protein [Spirosomataceae bacterium]